MFEVKKHLIKLQGNRLYLPVASRLVWFRQEHPDWGIETKPVVIDTERQIAVFEATVYNAEGKLMAKGTKMEDAQGFPDYIEKAETGAIGRALAVCGFGTQFAPDLDEVTAGRVVDNPQPAQGRYQPNGNTNGNGNDGYANYTQRYQPLPRPASNQPESNDHANNENSSSQSLDKDSDHACAGCGRSVTKGQEALSIRKFGVALCPDCQKERKTAEAAA